ncbi:tubulin polyglutamylase TTLL11 [Bufo bufo]|uniref:tubulin polyglutamylase TTLL11 n=1 Tax=Bufo bufo TaxID=8384 RepID=UPI001ABED635|nr:tubulin polyglutamylase TTLL11 [Bufo bufo]
MSLSGSRGTVGVTGPGGPHQAGLRLKLKGAGRVVVTGLHHGAPQAGKERGRRRDSRREEQTGGGVATPGVRSDTGATPGVRRDTGATPGVRRDTGATPGVWKDTGATPGVWKDTGATPGVWKDTGATPGVRSDTGATPGVRSDTGATPGVRKDTGATPGVRSDTGATPGVRKDTGATPGVRKDTGATPGVRKDTGATPGVRKDTGATPGVRKDTGATPGVWKDTGATPGVWKDTGATPGVWKDTGATPGVWKDTGATPGVGKDTGATPGVWKDTGATPGVRKDTGATPGVWKDTGATPGVRKDTGATPGVWKDTGATPGVWKDTGATPGVWKDTGATPGVWKDTGATPGVWKDTGATPGVWKDTGATPGVWKDTGATPGVWKDTGATPGVWKDTGATPGVWKDTGATPGVWKDTGATPGVRKDSGATPGVGADISLSHVAQSIQESKDEKSVTGVRRGLQTESEVTRGTRADSGVPRPPGADSGVPRPPGADSGVPRPPGADSGVPRPPGADSGVPRPPGADSGVPRPPGADSGVPRPPGADSGVPRPPGADSGVPRPPGADSGVPRPPGADSGVIRVLGGDSGVTGHQRPSPRRRPVDVTRPRASNHGVTDRKAHRAVSNGGSEARGARRRPVTVDSSKAKTSLEALRIGIKQLKWKEFPLGRRLPCDIYWHGVSFYESENLCSGEVNKFPGMAEVVRKISLSRAMRTMQELYPEEYDFYPQSWVLPEEYHIFSAEVRMAKDNNPSWKPTFIVKPDGGCQGDGIYLIKDPAEVRTMTSLQNRPAVVQEYITKPLLIDRLKFDLRLYVLLKSLEPLEIYMSKDGLSRFCTEQYQEPNHKNLHHVYMHLTNYSLNIHSSNFIHSNSVHTGSKRTVSSVLYRLLAKGMDIKNIWSDIIALVVKTVVALIPELKVYYQLDIPPGKPGPSCFQILGFDILLMKNLKPVLLEVNANPSMKIEHEEELLPGVYENVPSPVDEEVKSAVIRDTLRLVHLESRSKQKPSPSSGKMNDVQSGSPDCDPERSESPNKRHLPPLCLKQLYPKYSKQFSHLRVLERITSLFIRFLGVKGSMRMGPTGFRTFIWSCQLSGGSFSMAAGDILYIDITRRWNSQEHKESGMCLQAFFEAFFHLARRRYKGLALHEKVQSLVEFCECQLDSVEEKRLLCSRALAEQRNAFSTYRQASIHRTSYPVHRASAPCKLTDYKLQHS